MRVPRHGEEIHKTEHHTEANVNMKLEHDTTVNIKLERGTTVKLEGGADAKRDDSASRAPSRSLISSSRSVSTWVPSSRELMPLVGPPTKKALAVRAKRAAQKAEEATRAPPRYTTVEETESEGGGCPSSIPIHQRKKRGHHLHERHCWVAIRTPPLS
jgi:hypothetical protein